MSVRACFALLSLLVASGCAAQDSDAPIDVELAEIPGGPDAAGESLRLAVTAAGTLLVAQDGALLRHEGGGQWTPVGPDGHVVAALGASDSSLLVAHEGGCDVSTDDGQTWTRETADWQENPDVVLGQLRGDDAVLALWNTAEGIALLESPGLCRGWSRRGSAAIPGFELSHVSFVHNTVYVQLVQHHEFGITVVKLMGEDGGREWFSVDAWPGVYQPLTETPDGLAIAKGSFSWVYSEDSRALEGSSGWRPIDVRPAAPRLSFDALHVDHQGYLYYGARYRSVEPL